MNLFFLSLWFLLPIYCQQEHLVVPELRPDGLYEFDCVVCAENGLGDIVLSDEYSGFQYNEEYLRGFSARENRVRRFITDGIPDYSVDESAAWRQGYCSAVRIEFQEIVLRNKKK